MGVVTTVDQTIYFGSQAGDKLMPCLTAPLPPANVVAGDHFQKQVTPGRVRAGELEKWGLLAFPLEVLFLRDLCEWPAETRVHCAGTDKPATQTPLCPSSKGSFPSSVLLPLPF